jgi:endonuclease/exonuclease/phosphatase family metal-dependent hydrolase
MVGRLGMGLTVRRLVGALVACWLAGCAAIRVPVPPAAPPAGRQVLAVVSWNMHHGSGNLSRLVADLTRGPVAATAAGYVFLLQEATTGGTRDTLAESAALGFTTHFSPVRQRKRQFTGNAIATTLPLTATRVIPLPRARQPRSAVAAAIAVDGIELFVASVHLENRVGWTRGLLFSDGARGRQAETLIAALPPASPGIVGGDMNTWLGPSEPAWRTLFARFPDTPPRPEPTVRDRLVLDHLFFDLPDGWTATRQVLPDSYGSDHNPVLGLLYANHTSKVTVRR